MIDQSVTPEVLRRGRANVQQPGFCAKAWAQPLGPSVGTSDSAAIDQLISDYVQSGDTATLQNILVELTAHIDSAKERVWLLLDEVTHDYINQGQLKFLKELVPKDQSMHAFYTVVTGSTKMHSFVKEDNLQKSKWVLPLMEPQHSAQYAKG